MLKFYLYLVMFLSNVIEISGVTYSGIFIMKYLNERLAMDQLSIVNLIGSTIGVVILSLSSMGFVVKYLKRKAVLINVVADSIWICTSVIIFVNPFLYMVTSAIFEGVIHTFMGAANRYIINGALIGDEKAKYEILQQISSMTGVITGSIIGIIYSDINIYIAVFVLLAIVMIVTPLSVLRLLIAKKIGGN